MDMAGFALFVSHTMWFLDLETGFDGNVVWQWNSARNSVGMNTPLGKGHVNVNCPSKGAGSQMFNCESITQKC